MLLGLCQIHLIQINNQIDFNGLMGYCYLKPKCIRHLRQTYILKNINEKC